MTIIVLSVETEVLTVVLRGLTATSFPLTVSVSLASMQLLDHTMRAPASGPLHLWFHSDFCALAREICTACFHIFLEFLLKCHLLKAALPKYPVLENYSSYLCTFNPPYSTYSRRLFTIKYTDLLILFII